MLSVMCWTVFTVLTWSFAVANWIDYFLPSRPQPIQFTVAAVVVTLLAVWRGRVLMSRLKALGLGRRGERVVGALLTRELLPQSFHVLHDVPGSPKDDWNIDHVALGPSGIYAIETKTVSKRNGQARIKYDGRQVIIDGRRPDRDPLAQARGSADRIRQVLEETTGRRQFHVQPVVLYPGWFIEGSSTGRQVWVLAPSAFVKWVTGSRAEAVLSTEDVALYASRLSDYVRSVDEPHVAH